MSVELGTAYLSVTSDTKDLASNIYRELGVVEREADKSGQSIGSRLGEGITGGLKVVSAGVAGVVAAVGGLALTGGISRALAIDAAESKMGALGYTTEQVTGVMDTALASVKGTAFGLGDAASLATQLLASGVAEGDELSRALAATADMAAVAGVGLGDLSPVMGQMAAGSRLYTEDLRQIQERGLPVFQWLADSMGVTQEVAREMVSAGQVSFDQLQTAIEQSIGGAAKATDSFSSSWANVQAALGRGGAAAATPALAALKDVFDQAIPAIDNVVAGITPLIEGLAGRLSPAISDVAGRFFEWLAGIDFSALASGLGSVSGLLGPLAGLGAGALGPLLSGLPMVGGLFSGLTGPIGLILSLITQIFTRSPALRQALGGALEAVGGALSSLAPVFAVVSDLVGLLAGAVGDALAVAIAAVVPPLVEIATMLGPMLAETFTLLGPLIAVLAETIGTLLGEVLAAVLPLLVELAAQILPVLLDVVAAIIPVLTEVAAAILPALVAVVTALSPILALVMGLFDELMPVVMALIPPVLSLVEALAPFIVQVVELIADLLPPLIDLFMGVIGPVIDLAMTVLDALMPVIEGLLTALVGLIGFVTAVFAGDWEAAWSSIGDFFSGIWDAIVSAISGIGDILGEIPQMVGDIFANVGEWLLDAGRWLIEGLKNGITAAAAGLADFVLDPIRDAVDGVKDFLGIASPSRLFMAIGQDTAEGLALGLDDGATDVRSSIGSLASQMNADFATTANLSTGPAATGDTYNVDVTIPADTVADFVTVTQFFQAVPGLARAKAGVA